MSDLGNKQIMADNIIYYMNLLGKTRGDICRDLDFKYTTVTGWITGEKYPRIDKIELLANYFGITKADLVERRLGIDPIPFKKKSDTEELGAAIKQIFVEAGHIAADEEATEDFKVYATNLVRGALAIVKAHKDGQ